jgi:hypothetical protein
MKVDLTEDGGNTAGRGIAGKGEEEILGCGCVELAVDEILGFGGAQMRWRWRVESFRGRSGAMVGADRGEGRAAKRHSRRRWRLHAD